MDIPYSLDQFQKDIENVKPRIFDLYILPPFMMYYAVKSKGMSRIARRILFTASVYMFYRSYSSYKAIVQSIIPGTSPPGPASGGNQGGGAL